MGSVGEGIESLYLEGLGDLVSRLTTPITNIVALMIPRIAYLLNPRKSLQVP